MTHGPQHACAVPKGAGGALLCRGSRAQGLAPSWHRGSPTAPAPSHPIHPEPPRGAQGPAASGGAQGTLGGFPCPSTGQNARKAGPYPAEEAGSCATASSPGGRFPPRSREAGGQKLPSCPGWPRSPRSRWPQPIPVGVRCLHPAPRPEPGKGLRPPHPSQNAGLSIWVPSAAVCSRPLPQP